MNNIEKFVSEKNYTDAIQECVRNDLNNFGLLLSYATSSTKYVNQFSNNIKGISNEGKIINEICGEEDENSSLLSDDDSGDKKFVRVKLLCHWESPENIRGIWNKLSKNGDYTWNNIKLVLEDNPDYYVVINSPWKNEKVDPAKTIVFSMDTTNKNICGEWANPDPNKFFKVLNHSKDYNNICWKISSTYQELKTIPIKKTESVLSTILSDKYSDSGQIKKVDFVKFMERKGLSIHVHGDNKRGYKDYKGSLPIYKNDDGVFPYKYIFNCENHSLKNYLTEKLIDGILGECLVFYSGCYNAREFIDERSFVYLELSNFEEDYKKVKNAIENNLWEERLPYIRESKRKILEYLQFFPRLERIINKTEDVKYTS
jgi:hypothetical protein